MNHAARAGLLALASLFVCLGTAQAEMGSLWELGTKWANGNQPRSSGTAQHGGAQLAFASNQQLNYPAQQNLQPTAYCGDTGYYSYYGDDGGCEPGCACEPGCYCEPGCACEGYSDCCAPCGTTGGLYAEVDMMLLRAHVNEGAFGKLSEEYEFSPRTTVGAVNARGQGGRVRLWHYGHHQSILGGNGGVRFEWNVLDAELTKQFQFMRTDATLGGGIRLASNEISSGGVTDEIDLLGLVLGADFETICACYSNSYISTIYGGRISLLGGDWERQGTTLLHDDNLVTHELYAGAEYGCSLDGVSLYMQAKFEMQKWNSDFLASVNGGQGYSVGFVGPSFTFGVGY